MSEEKYILRDLTADDVFPMFKIISGIGIKEFKGCFESDDVREAIKKMASDQEEGKEVDTSAIGIAVAIDIASVIISNLPKCKDDIYLLLSGLSGMGKKEIAALPMNTFIHMVIDVVKKEEFKDFFQDVQRLFK